MALAGFKVESSYTPHMTLLWANRQIEEEYPIAPIGWEVRDFALIASHQGLSRYDVVRRWRLTSSGECSGRQIADMAAIAPGIPAAGPDQRVPDRR